MTKLPRRSILSCLSASFGARLSCSLKADENALTLPAFEGGWTDSHPLIEYWCHAFASSHPGVFTRFAMEEGQIVAVLADGSHLVVEDFVSGRSFEDRLEEPDLIDVVSDPYPRSLALPRWPKHLDPGRYRNDGLFAAVYGKSEEEVRANLVPVEFAGHKVHFNSRNGAAEALGRVGERIRKVLELEPESRPHLERLGGDFSWRKIAGTERMSSHSFGAAIDLNPALGGYWRWSKDADLSDMKRRLDYPASIVKAFEEEKFIWGGKWYHFDLMHFEYRPEFFA